MKTEEEGRFVGSLRLSAPLFPTFVYSFVYLLESKWSDRLRLIDTSSLIFRRDTFTRIACHDRLIHRSVCMARHGKYSSDVRREFPAIPHGFSTCYLLRRQLFSLPGFLDCTMSSIFRKGDSESRWNVTDDSGRKEETKGESRRRGSPLSVYRRSCLVSPSIIQVARLTGAPYHAMPHTSSH